MWKWHLRQLNHYADVFDGRRIFAVTTGPDQVPPAELLSLLPPRSEMIALPNHPELREVYSFPMLLARAFSLDPADSVFYAHTKGISWTGSPLEQYTRWWSLAMYRWLLGPQAIELAAQAPAVGWLKFQGQTNIFPEWSKWHYPGTFWWFRADQIFGRNWWSAFPGRYGVEAYLSAFFEDAHAASLYNVQAHQYFNATGLAGPYLPEFWAQLPPVIGPDADSYAGTPE